MSDYGAQDTSTTTLGANQFPISEAWTPNAGFSAVEGGTQTTDAGGKKSAPVRIEVKDGSDVTQGLTTDPAVTGDNPGTLSAKLRGLSKIWADVWDSVNHRLHVNVDAGSITANAGTNLNTSALALEAGHLANIDTHTPTQGQATKANSSPVVLASDQGDLLIKGDFTEVAGAGTGVVTGIGTFLLPETDVSAYKHFSMTLSGTWTMTLIVEVSNTSGANYQTLIVQQPNPSIANFSSITANGTYDAPLKWRFLRIRVSAFTSNASLASTFEFHTLPGALEAINAVQVGTWTVQPGNTQNTTPWLVSTAQIAGTATSVNAGNRDAGTQRIIESGNPTPTVTQVTSAASDTSLLAANANKKGTLFFNDSTATLYLLYGTGAASLTNYSVQIQPKGYFEDPLHYTGGFHGIWSAANGFVYCTEVS